MHLQPAFRQPQSNGMHDLLRLRLTAAVDHRIIGITRKGTLREVSLHPCVKRIVHEQIHQHRADSSANNIANSRVKWGLRISRECLAPWSRGCPDVDAVLVLETIAPADREARQ